MNLHIHVHDHRSIEILQRSLHHLQQKVFAMSQQVDQLVAKVATLETSLAAEVAQSAAFRTTVTNLIGIAGQLKTALDQVLANPGGISPEDVAAITAANAKLDELITAANADTAADTAANQDASDAVAVDAP